MQKSFASSAPRLIPAPTDPGAREPSVRSRAALRQTSFSPFPAERTPRLCISYTCAEASLHMTNESCASGWKSHRAQSGEVALSTRMDPRHFRSQAAGALPESSDYPRHPRQRRNQKMHHDRSPRLGFRHSSVRGGGRAVSPLKTAAGQGKPHGHPATPWGIGRATRLIQSEADK